MVMIGRALSVFIMSLCDTCIDSSEVESIESTHVIALAHAHVN